MTRPRHLTSVLANALAASALIGTALAPLPVMAQQRVEVGNAASVVGTVRLSNAQIREPRAIERRQRIAWGDLIETGRQSQMQILLLDRSTFGIGARSSIRIDSYVYDPDAGRSVFATLLRGALRFFSGRQEGTNSAEVQAPAGRIGIRGTAIDMLAGEDARRIARNEAALGDFDARKDEATLVVLRGPGAGTAGGLTTGLAEVEGAGITVVLDEPGLAAFIPRAGAAPIGPFRISDAGLARLQEELAPSVANAGNGGLLEVLVPAIVGAAAVGVLLGTTGGNDEQPSADTGAPNTNTSPNDPID